jgi:hypothetical protein
MQTPHQGKNIYATFVLTTACEVIFTTNIDASAIYWANFSHNSASLTSTASTRNKGTLPAAKCDNIRAKMLQLVEWKIRKTNSEIPLS